MHQKAVEMYRLFKCNNFGDYHDAYLETDVFLLAYVFELFRSVCINVYCLDPAYFCSAPNLSWDAMLITTDVELGLLSVVDMLLFCEKAIRGGLNRVGALRHFREKNKDLNDYNKDQKSVYGAFLDVTSLYGGMMMKNCHTTDTSGLSLLILILSLRLINAMIVSVTLSKLISIIPPQFKTIILIFHWLLRKTFC